MSLNNLTGTDWVKFTKSWFTCNPPPRTAEEKQHPAKFPEALVEDFIKFFTRIGERVLDPFAGTGSTLRGAHNMSRQGVGIELSQEYVDVAEARLPMAARIFRADARTLIQSGNNLCGFAPVQFIFTSPPYWNMLHMSRGGSDSVHKQRTHDGLDIIYGTDPRDIGNLFEYQDFLFALCEVLVNVRELLEPNRYMVVVMQNVRTKDGEVRPLAWDVVGILREYWTFKGERIWCQDSKRLGIWGYPSEFVTNVHHHYCLVFKNDRLEVK